MYQRSYFIPVKKPKPPKRRLIRDILATALRRTVMVLGTLFLFSIITGSVISWMVVKDIEPILPEKFVLYMPVYDDFAEHENDISPYDFAAPPPLFREVIDALDAAAQDKRVKGLVVDLSEGAPLSLAHIEELRAALKRFRMSGKFAYIYSTSYGEMGRGLGTYYLASAFNNIWMQPMGVVSMAGIKAEVPFVRDTLDKIGVEPQFFSRKEYKTLFQSFTGREMSAASREEIETLVNDLAGQMIQGIAADRGMSPESVRGFVNKGIFIDSEALAAGLVTHVDDFEALKAAVIKEVDPKSTAAKIFVRMGGYINSSARGKSGKNVIVKKGADIALVYIQGMIGFSDEADVTGAENITDDIYDIAEDKGIKVIVIRINSPGGSPAAAESIRRAILKAQKNGKKIVVSMGDMAASGGYWVAAPADRIFALPVTLTGSIGVAGGKFVFAELWKKVGVNWQSVQYGDNAGIWSPNEKFSDSGTERMNAVMDSVYSTFVALVAEGRHLSPAVTEKAARGRVWSGRQAQAEGLVDELGGLDRALDYAAAQLKLKDRTALEIEVFPRPLSPVEKVFDFLEGQVAVQDALKDVSKIRPFLQSLAVQMNARTGLAYEPLTVR